MLKLTPEMQQPCLCIYQSYQRLDPKQHHQEYDVWTHSFQLKGDCFKLDLAAASMTLVLPVKATFNFHVRRDGSTGSWSVSDDEVENTGRETSFLHEGTAVRGVNQRAEKRTFFFFLV
jgi:hypothetical protein